MLASKSSMESSTTNSVFIEFLMLVPSSWMESFWIFTFPYRTWCRCLILGLVIARRYPISAINSCSYSSPTFSVVEIVSGLAITKLLVPSHADRSTSLYSHFMSWLEEQGRKPQGFKGFQSNRFGCIAETDKEFLELRNQMCGFIDSCVDINTNKFISKGTLQLSALTGVSLEGASLC